MADLGLGEPIVDAVIAKLQAGVPARIATINAADTNGVTVTAPSDDDYYFGGADQIPRAPAYIVTEGRPADGALYENEGPHSFIYADTIVVAVYDEDVDRQHLARKLLRHKRAIIEAVWDDDPKERLADANGNSVAFHIAPITHEPGPVLDPEDTGSQTWRGYHAVVFTTRKAEL